LLKLWHFIVERVVAEDRRPQEEGRRKQNKAQKCKQAQIQNPGFLSFALHR